MWMWTEQIVSEVWFIERLLQNGSWRRSAQDLPLHAFICPNTLSSPFPILLLKLAIGNEKLQRQKSRLVSIFALKEVCHGVWKFTFYTQTEREREKPESQSEFCTNLFILNFISTVRPKIIFSLMYSGYSETAGVQIKADKNRAFEHSVGSRN